MSTSRRVTQQRQHQRRAQEQSIREHERARRRRMFLAGGVFGTVLMVIAVLVVVRLARPERSAGDVTGTTLASVAVVDALTVEAAVLDQVGRGKVEALPVRLPAQPPLTVAGKPLVLYVGAEYCPFCAAQRWPLMVALSRFGTFSGLKSAHSASDDVFPDTATLSFHGATYTSDYLAFEGVEMATSERQGAQYAPLQALTPAQEAVVRTYNAPPYVPARSAGAIPFLDFGNQFIMTGTTVDPTVLKGLSDEQIAVALSNPDSPVGRTVLGSANAMTAVLCQLTGGQPAAVCSAPGVVAFAELRS
ncbi:MAG: DUF929 family protein [Micromonosporaceae bacterium]